MKNNINFDEIVNVVQLECHCCCSNKGAFDCIDELYNFIFSTSEGCNFSETNLINIGGNDSILPKCLLKDSKKLINNDAHTSFLHGAIIPADAGQARSYVYHNHL
jgi:hypothetical protein|tara:strand:+ start:105 stop:419 length:315 start_codon:yes stop_codon:yes gene_type:complete